MSRSAGFRGVDLLKTLGVNKKQPKTIFSGKHSIVFAVINAAKILSRQQLQPYRSASP